MDNPVTNKDLVESILELRGEAEQRLMRNKYYLAMVKLDELLELIRTLEADKGDEQRSKAAAPSEAPLADAHRDELGDEPDAEMLVHDDDVEAMPRYSEDAA